MWGSSAAGYNGLWCPCVEGLEGLDFRGLAGVDPGWNTAASKSADGGGEIRTPNLPIQSRLLYLACWALELRPHPYFCFQFGTLKIN